MKFSRLTYSLATVFLCYGAVVFSFGPCLTSMADTFGVPVGRLGLIFTLYAVGLIPSVLLNGYLSEVMGRRLIMLAAIGMMALACALLGLITTAGGPRSFSLVLAAMVLLGYGGGGIETLTNILVNDDNQPAPAFALNVTHAFFAIGAVLSPLAVSLLLRSHLAWQLVFYGNAALLAALVVVLIPQRMPSATSEPFPPRAALELLRSSLVWMLLAMIALYVGAETGLAAWVSPLMETVLGAKRDVAGLSVSAFWALMIVGRLVVSPLSVRLRPPPLLFVLGLGSALSSLAVAYASDSAGCLIAAGAAGLFMSGIFALVLVDASRHFPRRLGAVFGIMMVGVGLGSLIIPAAMGWISAVAGLRVAMAVPAALLGAVALAYLARWSQ
jgi:FHS family glucose/mannose:H+ symporter-like MFS transporter